MRSQQNCNVGKQVIKRLFKLEKVMIFARAQYNLFFDSTVGSVLFLIVINISPLI